MLSSKFRWLVVASAFILLGVAIYKNHLQIATLAIGGICYLIWSYFREGTVFLATQAFQNKDYAKAKGYLEEIRRPEYLRKRRRNYYEFMMANIALQEEDFENAEIHFQIASRMPFKRSNDKAIILIHLANLNLRKKDYQRVNAYLEVARELEVSSSVSQIIEKIAKEIPVGEESA